LTAYTEKNSLNCYGQAYFNAKTKEYGVESLKLDFLVKKAADVNKENWTSTKYHRLCSGDL
jgi:hypothetical protein